MAFNPDEDLQSSGSTGFNPNEDYSPASSGFNPNEDYQEGGGFLQNYVKPAVGHLANALPYAGMAAGGLAGGVLGGAAGGVGAIPGGIAGAGLGGAAGESARQGLLSFIGQGAQTRPEQYQAIAGRGLEGAQTEMGGQAIGSAVKSGVEALPKIAHSLSGVSEQAYKTFSEHQPEVSAMLSRYGTKVADAFGDFQNAIASHLDSFKNATNDQINKIVSGDIGNRPVNIQGIFDNLEKSKNAQMSMSGKESVQKIIDGLYQDYPALRSRIDSGGLMGSASGMEKTQTVKMANDIRGTLQRLSEDAYKKDIFTNADAAANAANKAYGEARNLIYEEAPELRAQMTKLSKLHDIEDMVPPALRRETGSAAHALARAGANPSGFDAKALSSLQEFMPEGFNPLSEAQKLNSYKEFANPDVISARTTGRSAIGGMIGHALGGETGIGTLAGFASGSPTVHRALIEGTPQFLRPSSLLMNPAVNTAGRGLIRPGVSYLQGGRSYGG